MKKRKTLSKEEIIIREKSRKRLNMIITNVIRILLVGIIVLDIVLQDFDNIFIAILTLAMTYYPSLLEKRFGVYLPAHMQIAITLFIFGAQYLGEIRDFYNKFWWWDTMLHTISGIILGVIGFMFVYLLNEKYGKRVKLSPAFVAMFAFCFAVTIGVFWEFFEFGADRILGFNMQKFRFPELGQDGLIDTMTDLFVDAIGALITSTLGYLYIKEKNDVLLRDWFRHWFKHEEKQKEKIESKKEKIMDVEYKE